MAPARLAFFIDMRAMLNRHGVVSITEVTLPCAPSRWSGVHTGTANHPYGVHIRTAVAVVVIIVIVRRGFARTDVTFDAAPRLAQQP